ncbi:MAG: tetratricopeptide repeat protein, partial [candidate division Zixibacteria bacterium]
EKARALKSQKHYAAALSLVQWVLESDPANSSASILKEDIRAAVAEEIATQRRRGESALNDGNIITAIEAYNRILELDPENEAIKASRRVAISFLDVAQQLQLGIQQFNRGRINRAERSFLAVLEIDSANEVAQEYLSKVAEARATPSAPGLSDLQRNPEIWAHYLQGFEFMREGEYQNAIDAWQKVLKAFPDNEDTRNNLEQARLRLESQE